MPAKARYALGPNGREAPRKCHHNTSCQKAFLSRTRKAHYNGTSLPWDDIPSSESERDSEEEDDLHFDDASSDIEEMQVDLQAHGDHSAENDSTMCSPSPSPLPLKPYLDDGWDSDDENDSISRKENPEVKRWSDYQDLRGVLEEGQMSVEDMVAELQEMMLAEEDELVFTHGQKKFTEKDRDNCRAFLLKVLSNMTRDTFNQMREAFSHKLEINSEWVIIHKMAMLSGVEPIWVDCCRDGCMAFTGEHENLSHCKYCGAVRCNEAGKPVRQFAYLPLIPRLKGFFMNKEKIKQLRYRINRDSSSTVVSDVFDAENYKNLCKQQVKVDKKTLPHEYFSGDDDIALGFCTDSYLLFNRQRDGPSATPILLTNYNVPPHLRTHLEHLLCLGVLPNNPVDLRSYMSLLDNELAQLAHGVHAHHAGNNASFLMRAYMLVGMGDMVAIYKVLNIKGANSASPCRSCEIRGTRVMFPHLGTFYYPLTWPDNPDDNVRMVWDPWDLPLRTEERYELALAHIERAQTKKDKEAQAKHWGVRGLPVLRPVDSLDRGRSFPEDFMHMVFEHVFPMLYEFWTGASKDLDHHGADYVIPAKVWDEVWAETTDSMKYIPSAFTRSLARGVSKFTAESWCFWFVWMLPRLLKGRFPNLKYYKHACQLGEIVKLCLRFDITHQEINDLEDSIIDWVQKYEEYYYQYKPERLSACTTTIHALLHIPRNIRNCGPVWTWWTFSMERYCGFLKYGLHSRKRPHANLSRRLIHFMYLEQIALRYDLGDELAIFKPVRKEVTSTEQIFEDYPQAIVGAPRQKQHTPAKSNRQGIAKYLANVLDNSQVSAARIERNLPQIMPRWGLLRIVGGDRMRADWKGPRNADELRDTTFVRFVKQVEKRNEWVPQLGYGRLDEILECEMPPESWLKQYSGKTLLFAVITPCSNSYRDASKKVVAYTAMDSPIVLDLQCIQAVAGRLRTRGQWVLLDRTDGLVKPEFIPSAQADWEAEEEATGVRYLFPRYLTITGTYSTYKDKNKLNAAVEGIASQLPFFRQYEGLWPIHQILRSFLQNHQSRLDTLLLKQKCWEEGKAVPVRRKGRKKHDDAEEADDEEEAEDADDEEEIETRPVKKAASSTKKPAGVASAQSTRTKSAATTRKPAPAKTAKSQRRNQDMEEEEAESTGSDAASERWETGKGSALESEGADATKSQVQLRRAQWSSDEVPDVKTRKSQQKKMIVNYDESDAEGGGHVEPEYHPEIREILDQAVEDLASHSHAQNSSPMPQPRVKPQICPLCDDPIPANRSNLLQLLLIKLKSLPDDSPAVRQLETDICEEIRRMENYDLALRTARGQGWPLSVDLNAIPERIFAMRAKLTELLTDERLLAENQVLVQFVKAIDYDISNYGHPGFWVIQASLYSLVFFALPRGQISLTLASVAELNQRWKLDDDCTLFSDDTFIANVLTPFVTMRLIQEDLHVGFADAMKTYTEAGICFDWLSTPPEDAKRDQLIENAQRSIKQLFLKEKEDGKREQERKLREAVAKDEVIDVDDKSVHTQPKKRKLEVEEEEVVVEQDEAKEKRPRKKQKTETKENKAPSVPKKVTKMSVDDFPPPVIKSPKKKKKKVEKPPAAKLHSYGMPASSRATTLALLTTFSSSPHILHQPPARSTALHDAKKAVVDAMSSQPTRPHRARRTPIGAKLRVSGSRLHACLGRSRDSDPISSLPFHAAPFLRPSTLSIWSHDIPHHPLARSKAPQDARKAIVDAMSSPPRRSRPSSRQTIGDPSADSGARLVRNSPYQGPSAPAQPPLALRAFDLARAPYTCSKNAFGHPFRAQRRGTAPTDHRQSATTAQDTERASRHMLCPIISLARIEVLQTRSPILTGRLGSRVIPAIPTAQQPNPVHMPSSLRLSPAGISISSMRRSIPGPISRRRCPCEHQTPIPIARQARSTRCAEAFQQGMNERLNLHLRVLVSSWTRFSDHAVTTRFELDVGSGYQVGEERLGTAWVWM
ncbi:hypothetical protein C8F01DRAFT_1267845 [Mycena amicta]|nr:hypothetical protein C8F01DRAFT_1267845 [Mycena amicta]